MASVDEAVETMKRAGVLIEHQRERVQELRDALAGMIGLIQMVRNRNDVSLDLREEALGDAGSLGDVTQRLVACLAQGTDGGPELQLLDHRSASSAALPSVRVPEV